MLPVAIESAALAVVREFFSVLRRFLQLRTLWPLFLRQQQITFTAFDIKEQTTDFKIVRFLFTNEARNFYFSLQVEIKLFL